MLDAAELIGVNMSELEKSKLKKLGRIIKRTRREMGMTQARLAELIGVEVSHIWRLEKGIWALLPIGDSAKSFLFLEPFTLFSFLKP